MAHFRLGLVGGSGRMASLLGPMVMDKNTGMDLAAVYCRKKPSWWTPQLGPEPFWTQDAEEFTQNVQAIIDFSLPDVSMRIYEQALKARLPMVIATTGFEDAQKKIWQKNPPMPVLLCPNTSLGAVTLRILSKKITEMLGVGLGVDLTECHHENKQDVPSGTALMLQKAVEEGAGQELPFYTPSSQHPTRPPSCMGLAVHRRSGHIGYHRLDFSYDGEEISLIHRALDRKLFAKGALWALQWLLPQKPGLYTLTQALGA